MRERSIAERHHRTICAARGKEWERCLEGADHPLAQDSGTGRERPTDERDAPLRRRYETQLHPRKNDRSQERDRAERLADSRRRTSAEV